MERIYELEKIDSKYYCSNYYDEINFIDPYGWFQLYFRYWLVRRYLDHKKQINRWKRIVSRFKGKLVKIMVDLMIILFHLKLE